MLDSFIFHWVKILCVIFIFTLFNFLSLVLNRQNNIFLFLARAILMKCHRWENLQIEADVFTLREMRNINSMPQPAFGLLSLWVAIIFWSFPDLSCLLCPHSFILPYSKNSSIQFVWWLFSIVNLTISGMTYNPEMEVTLVIGILRLEDTEFRSESWGRKAHL